MRALVVGDLMVVVTGRFLELPRAGQNVVLSGSAVHATGVAMNIALSLRALGVDVTVLGAVGDDALGETVERTLAAAGVDASRVRRRPDAPTATMLVMVEPSGQRTMVGTRGASERFDLGDAATILDEVAPDWMHVSGYTLLDRVMRARCAALLDAASTRGIPSSLDLEGISGAHERWLPMPATVAFCNLDEYREWFGVEEVAPIDHVWKALVVKAGANGCFLLHGGRVEHIPTSPVEAVDSTGAGDAFDAAYIAASLRGCHARTACAWGNAAGRVAVQVAGPDARLSIELMPSIPEASAR